jgi:hypothetical protein
VEVTGSNPVMPTHYPDRMVYRAIGVFAWSLQLMKYTPSLDGDPVSN